MPGNRRAKPAHKSGLISQYILLIASPKNAKIPGFTPFSVSWDKGACSSPQAVSVRLTL